MEVLLILAVLPGAWLLRYIYRLDPVEKEPGGLLVRLLLLGALACVPAVILEHLGMTFLMGGRTSYDIPSLLFENFIVVALSEEACKMFFLRLKTWKSSEFNYVFDGVVYAVFVSLGFAILENIGYVFEYGLGTALVRAFTAVPGHAVFGLFMGCFYGFEKRASMGDRPGLRIPFAICSLAIPVFCHGFYDFCASMPGDGFLIVFFAFLLLMVFVAAYLAKWMSKAAHHVHDGMPNQSASEYVSHEPPPPPAAEEYTGGRTNYW